MDKKTLTVEGLAKIGLMWEQAARNLLTRAEKAEADLKAAQEALEEITRGCGDELCSCCRIDA